MIVVGGNVTTMAIEATSAEAYVDFRRDYQKHRYELIELPQDIHMRIMALMRELDLAYGALGFVVGPDGSWTFLEVNAGGQYGWLEDQGKGAL
ncbi:hypothetical protein CFN78_20940 [Amycolatopsis antarctica]|uniref:ATP-grasp domain-containing protein n=1 Tax=Amycolatopsis antarctica TaxID=1854586 RepID=A0A263CZF0_9PSEU|nr:hypothetical protein [Amycolatopsis antarctica]OZM71268.1 hypothetical protein CFN78_20940 [Amycolatopsis antarctica]